MDRQVVYPGSIPLDTDLLNVERQAMTAIGRLAQVVLGTAPVVSGLVCAPTTPASLSVQVSAGSLSQMAQVDATAFGSLAADPTALVKVGTNALATTLALSAPSVAGTTIVWLVQAQMIEVDAAAVVLPYYNAGNPAVPYSGPGGLGGAQPTQRLQQVHIQAIPGIAASIATAVLPPLTPGWSPLVTVRVDAGTTQITADKIVSVASIPRLQFTLPQLRPGFSSTAVVTTSQIWTVPLGVTLLRIRLVGGGGGGGGGNVGFGGGGGGAGGYCEGEFSVVSGTVYFVAVGTGGVGSAPGSVASFGGTSSFGSFCSATGGGGGGSDPSNSAGGTGGFGFGGVLGVSGGCGQDGQSLGLTFAAQGAASAFGGGGRGAAGSNLVMNGLAPGSGAGGCYGVAAAGGNGAPGLVIIQY